MTELDADVLLANGDDDYEQPELDYDEESLLGTVSRKPTQESTDNHGDDVNGDDAFDSVEVDYDEDIYTDAGEEKRSEFDEKKSDSSFEKKNAKVVEDKNKNTTRLAAGANKKNLPSLMSLIPPGLPMPPTMPPVRLTIGGQTYIPPAPAPVFQPMPMPIQYPMGYPQPGFMPGIPMGMPMNMPMNVPAPHMLPNHGTAGFGPGHRDQRSENGVHKALGQGNWGQAVDLFLKGSKKSSRGRSRSSSRSRSRSRSPRRNGGGSRRGDRHRDERRRDDRRREERRRRSTEKRTIESAKALGLDDDYLRQVEEQKKKREEILRKKRDGREPEKKPSESSKSERSGSSKAEPSKTDSSKATTSSDREKKMKAYLAVNVTNVKDLLPAAEKRIERMAVDVGPIRKCWQSTEDIVSVIFHEHAKAKEFVMKYNNKVLMGVRVTLDLEKKYLNLSEMA